MNRYSIDGPEYIDNKDGDWVEYEEAIKLVEQNKKLHNLLNETFHYWMEDANPDELKKFIEKVEDVLSENRPDKTIKHKTI